MLMRSRRENVASVFASSGRWLKVRNVLLMIEASSSTPVYNRFRQQFDWQFTAPSRQNDARPREGHRRTVQLNRSSEIVQSFSLRFPRPVCKICSVGSCDGLAGWPALTSLKDPAPSPEMAAITQVVAVVSLITANLAAYLQNDNSILKARRFSTHFVTNRYAATT